jgi:hypothetical protein
MLTNLGSMEADAMHRMLSVVASGQVSGSFTESDLSDYLHSLDEKIEYQNGSFSLRKG